MEIISIEQIKDKSYISQELLNHIKCNVCENICIKPIKEQFCGKLFCLKCLNEFSKKIEKENVCPNQCEKVIFKEISKIERKCILDQININCKYKKLGCSIVYNYSNIEGLIQHQLYCDFQPEECDKCKENISKKFFFKHRLFCNKLGIVQIGKEEQIGETIVELIKERELIEKSISSQEIDLGVIEDELKLLRNSAKFTEEIKELKSDFELVKEEYGEMKKLIKELNELRFQIKLEDEFHERSINSLLSEMDYLKSRLENDTREVKIESTTLNRQLANFPKRYSRILNEIKLSLENKLETLGQEIVSTQPKLSTSRKGSKNINRKSQDRNEQESNLINSKHQITNNKESVVIPVYWENYGKTYKHKDNFDYTIQTESVMPQHFRASIRVTPPENNNPWFAFGVTRTKVNVDNRKFMWCSESISDCYAYNCNGMISDKEDSRKYGETFWQKTNTISIVLDRKNNISFEKNGENLGIAFKNVKGPFYLSASLLYKNYEVELLEIREL